MSGSSSTPDERPPWEGSRRPAPSVPVTPPQSPPAPQPQNTPARQPYTPPYPQASYPQQPQQPYPQPPYPQQGYVQPGQYPAPAYTPYPQPYGQPMYGPQRQSSNKALIIVLSIIGAFVILPILGVFVAVAIPTMGGGRENEAKSAEARAALGVLKDRLRVKFIQNNNRVNPGWTLNDLVNSEDFQGKYYGPKDYFIVGMVGDNQTIFRASANTQTGAPQVTMTITNVATGRAVVTSP